MKLPGILISTHSRIRAKFVRKNARKKPPAPCAGKVRRLCARKGGLKPQYPFFKEQTRVAKCPYTCRRFGIGNYPSRRINFNI
ncbi:MAG: hypothetical protein DBX55_06415 [Verrucomicrobia bacterium]|nr:MAG: hypothetical protein DBX55_06415 [Verrucomicrobiota bacterium]